MKKHIDSATLATNGPALPGEDRHYGGDDFAIDMIPSTSHHFNLRLMIPQLQWRYLRIYVVSRVGGCCEFCGSESNLEAHERWEFMEITRTQTLRRLMCLCKSCHLGVHIGLAGQIGVFDIVKNHVINITGWSDHEFADHMQSAKSKFDKLSKIRWKMDASMIRNVGIQLFDDKTIMENVKKKQEERAAYDQNYGIGSLSLIDEIRRGDKAYCHHEIEDLVNSILRESGTVEYKTYIHPFGDIYGIGGANLGGRDCFALDLKRFIKAFNNQISVGTEDELNLELQSVGPKTLIINEALFENSGRSLISRAFRKEILLLPVPTSG